MSKTPSSSHTFNRNLVEQILPPVELLTEEYGSDVPITELLISLARQARAQPTS